jgi:serine/threonine-protein kinase
MPIPGAETVITPEGGPPPPVINASTAPGRAPGPIGNTARPPSILDVVLEKELGRGGMGAVYRGRQVSLDRPVAVKVIHPALAQDQSFIDRFKREAQVLGKLQHPNIVACHLQGEAQTGELYLLMEFVEGEDLLRWVKRAGPLGERDALVITRQIAEALDHALEAGVIHRDVKPENILLKTVPPRTAATSIGVQAKLVDLGLAALARPDEAAMRITQAGTALGTPLTMAPEQAESPDAIDHRADIYALGCTLYFALTGRFPHEGSTVAQVLSKKLKGDTTDPSKLRPGLSADVARLTLDMMSYEKEARPATYEVLLGLLDAAIERHPAPAGMRPSARYGDPTKLASAAGAETAARPAVAAPRGGIGLGGKLLAPLLALVVLCGGALAYYRTTLPHGGEAPGTPPAPVTPPPVAPPPVTQPPAPTPPAPVTTPPAAPVVPVAPAAPSDTPPNLRWGDPEALFGADDKLFDKWDLEHKELWSHPESDGECDLVLEGSVMQASALLREPAPAGFRLDGSLYPKSSDEVGVRLVLADRTLDVGVRDLADPGDRAKPHAFLLKVARTDGARPTVLKSLSREGLDGSRRELSLVFSKGTLWARLDGGAGIPWAVVPDLPPVKRLGIYAKKGASSFGQLTLHQAMD